MRLTRSVRFGIALIVTAFITGCGEEPSAPAPFDESTLPPPSDETLALGQSVYRETCARCHRVGKAGSPKMGDAAAWAERIPKGTETLVRHAIEGFSGPAGDEMPPRGANEDLTDAEVAAAVAYLIHHSQ